MRLEAAQCRCRRSSEKQEAKPITGPRRRPEMCGVHIKCTVKYILVKYILVGRTGVTPPVTPLQPSSSRAGRHVPFYRASCPAYAITHCEGTLHDRASG